MGNLVSNIVVAANRPSKEDFEKRLASDPEFLKSYILYLEHLSTETSSAFDIRHLAAAGVQPVMTSTPQEYYIEKFNTKDEKSRRIAELKARLAVF